MKSQVKLAKSDWVPLQINMITPPDLKKRLPMDMSQSDDNVSGTSDVTEVRTLMHRFVHTSYRLWQQSGLHFCPF